jgi:nucleotide-binding universal stress UspA family protein
LPEPLQATVHEIVGTQHPRHGLIVAAEEWRADLIVVGARGVSRMEKLMLGSVSDSVVQTSHVPVLVVRPGSVSPAGEHALLCVDGSAASREAGSFLKNFTWQPGSVGRLLYVMESMFAGEIPEWLAEKARDEEVERMAHAWIAEHDAERAERRQELVTYSHELPAPFHGQEPIVAEGPPAEQIVKAIEESKTNLVVLGARGLGVWKRLLMGSTSHKVLLHAPCSVLVVRQHEKP